MNKIVKIRITRMWETCNRTTFYVELETDEGFTMTPSGHATGSDYTNGEGLSVEEARDRALIDAADWSDFLQIPVEPYVEEGVTYEPNMRFSRYTNRRVLAERGKRGRLAEEEAREQSGEGAILTQPIRVSVDDMHEQSGEG